jgi:hypothetical protein
LGFILTNIGSITRFAQASAFSLSATNAISIDFYSSGY